MNRATPNARETDANREFRNSGGGALQAFLLALMAFAVLNWLFRS
jgi:hypothetical protein